MKLKSKSGKDIVATLRRLGFTIARVGKHYIMRRGGVIVPVPYHREIPRGTIKAIIREAGISVREFLEHDP